MPNSNYKINEGNMIGGQEPQALGTVQARVTASAPITKGQTIESTGNWTVGPAGDNSAKYLGVSFTTAAVGEKVVIDTEGFVKLQATNAVIVAGATVGCGASGMVLTWASGDVVGKCIAGCAANGLAYIKLK